MSPKRWKQPPRGVVDTSVLVAGVSGFRGEPTDNPSATLLAAWTDAPTFVWLLTEEILSEYIEVLERLRVRSARRIVGLIREQGQVVRVINKLSDLPDRDDAPFCECAESADADFIVTLNPSDFPQSRLKAKVIAPTDPLPPRGRKLRPRRKASRDPQEVATFLQLGLLLSQPLEDTDQPGVRLGIARPGNEPCLPTRLVQETSGSRGCFIKDKAAAPALDALQALLSLNALAQRDVVVAALTKRGSATVTTMRRA